MQAVTGTDNSFTTLTTTNECKHRGLTNSNCQTTKNITAANQSVSTSQKYIIKANTSSLDLADDFHYKWSGQFIAC